MLSYSALKGLFAGLHWNAPLQQMNELILRAITTRRLPFRTYCRKTARRNCGGFMKAVSALASSTRGQKSKKNKEVLAGSRFTRH
jgi:hypothetical protein